MCYRKNDLKLNTEQHASKCHTRFNIIQQSNKRYAKVMSILMHVPASSDLRLGLLLKPSYHK